MIQVPQIHLPAEASLQNGKYQIISVLGQGGFGITYLAKHKVFGEVALKELFLNSGSAVCSRENTTHRQVIPHFKPDQFKTFKDRFLEEAKTLYNLRGVKGVVNVHDIFEENGTVYFSMEYLKGTKLDDYVKARTRLPEKDGLEILKALGRSLSAIHEKNVLHRDIKPANIIIGEHGEVHLIDFGIAKSYLEEVDETHTTFHSPRYSPPEQKIARSRMGTFSDVYSLGATAYFLFTGKPPQSFEERLLEVDVYKPPKFYAPALSDATNNTIVKSLILKDRDRIQTAPEFLAGLPDTAGPNTFRESIPAIAGSPTTTIEDDKTKIDYQTAKKEPLTIDDKTEIGPVDDKTKIVSAPPQKRLENVTFPTAKETPDDRTVIANNVHREDVDHDRTVIDQGEPQEEKKDWKTWILNNKKIMISVGILGLFFSIVFLYKDPPPPPPVPTPPINRSLNFMVKDLENKEVLPVAAMIGKNKDILKIDSLGQLKLDITEQWKRFKSQIITVSNSGYPDLKIPVRDLVNKDTILYLEKPAKVIDERVPNPEKLCENISGSWISESGKKLDLKVCITQEETNNPGGNAVFEDNSAIWSSFKQESEIHFKLAYLDDLGEELDFQITNPYRKNRTAFILNEGNKKIIFERYVDKGKLSKPPKDYNLIGQVYDQDGYTITDAHVSISNSKLEMTAMNQGNFYFDLTDDWAKIKNQELTVTHPDFKEQIFKVKNLVNRDKYIIYLEPKPKDPAPDEGDDKDESDFYKIPPPFCSNLNGYWMHNSSGNVMEMRDCSGDTPRGRVTYNGLTGTWSTGFNNEGNIILDLSINGAKGMRMEVKDPALNTRISLMDQGKVYKRRNIKYIFDKRIIGTYSDHKGNKLLIKNINGNRGNAVYKGKEGTFVSSKIEGNGDKTILSVECNGKKYKFNVLKITEKGNTYLELIDGTKRKKYTRTN